MVLSFSLKLREKLKETGRYKVLMTRETDVFVPLNKRRAFAEQNQAALFVAVHADYAQSGARGATIYSLREGVASALQRSARGEASDIFVANNTHPMTSRCSRKFFSSLTIALDCPGTSHSK